MRGGVHASCQQSSLSASSGNKCIPALCTPFRQKQLQNKQTLPASRFMCAVAISSAGQRQGLPSDFHGYVVTGYTSYATGFSGVAFGLQVSCALAQLLAPAAGRCSCMPCVVPAGPCSTAAKNSFAFLCAGRCRSNASHRMSQPSALRVLPFPTLVSPPRQRLLCKECWPAGPPGVPALWAGLLASAAPG